jgi:hypothetical protein
MLRGAAAMSWLLGLGFGIPGVIGMVHLARTGEIWTLMGFPTYGHGPFERVGLGTSVTLLAAFVAVCAAELVTGTMLWTGASGAVATTWALLPFGPVLAVVRTALILLA